MKIKKRVVLSISVAVLITILELGSLAIWYFALASVVSGSPIGTSIPGRDTFISSLTLYPYAIAISILGLWVMILIKKPIGALLFLSLPIISVLIAAFFYFNIGT